MQIKYHRCKFPMLKAMWKKTQEELSENNNLDSKMKHKSNFDNLHLLE